MINTEVFKERIYQKEKKKLIKKFIFINVIIVFILSISLSNTKTVNHREKELITMNRDMAMTIDSLKGFINNELYIIKDNENNVILKSLSLSMDNDEMYYDFFNNHNINDLYSFANFQLERYSSIENVINNKWDSINNYPFGNPISLADLNDITDVFGYRKHPIIKSIIFHEGVDISAPEGSEVFTTGNGIVEKVIKSDRGYGNRIVINHGNGYRTVYAHLSGFNVQMGQSVNKNDVIGYVGSTGLSTGPHLHYEVLYRNRPVDPLRYAFINTNVSSPRNVYFAKK